MTATEFTEANIRIAENQPEYETLPAFHNAKEGSVMFGFDLTDAEVEEVIKNKKFWVKQLTFNKAMQPIAVSVTKETLL